MAGTIETVCAICGGPVNITKKNYLRMVRGDESYKPICGPCKRLASFATTNTSVKHFESGHATLKFDRKSHSERVRKTGKVRRRRND
jgi:hypothetical protein